LSPYQQRYMRDKFALERAARYLMGLLKTEPVIRYSRFHDGTVETAKALNRTLGLEENGWLPGHGLMNWAICKLEAAGLVMTEELPVILVDGDTDYDVRLTDEGRAFIDQGRVFALPPQFSQYLQGD